MCRRRERRAETAFVDDGALPKRGGALGHWLRRQLTLQGSLLLCAGSSRPADAPVLLVPLPVAISNTHGPAHPRRLVSRRLRRTRSATHRQRAPRGCITICQYRRPWSKFPICGNASSSVSSYDARWVMLSILSNFSVERIVNEPNLKNMSKDAPTECPGTRLHYRVPPLSEQNLSRKGKFGPPPKMESSVPHIFWHGAQARSVRD